MAVITDDTVVMPIKTKRSVRDKASILFRSRGITMTAGVNMLLTQMIAKRSFTLSFDEEEEVAFELSVPEKKEMNFLQNLSSFLASVPG